MKGKIKENICIFLICGSGTEIWPFYLFNLRRRSTLYRHGKKGQYVGPWAINKKNEDTLLSRTLKVEEKKVSLVFLFVAQGERHGHFSHLTIPHSSIPKFQKIIWPYLGSWATNQKTKDTFFPSTFKVWESKISSFF